MSTTNYHRKSTTYEIENYRSIIFSQDLKNTLHKHEIQQFFFNKKAATLSWENKNKEAIFVNLAEKLAVVC